VSQSNPSHPPPAAGPATEVTYHGVVYPAQTDAMGHMTIQYYVAAFDQASWHFIHRLGYNPDWRVQRNEGWADVNHQTNFRGELKVGDIFTVCSSLVRMGASSLQTLHQMFDKDRQLCADIVMTSVYFDLLTRQSKAIPHAIRARAAPYLSAPDNPPGRCMATDPSRTHDALTRSRPTTRSPA